MSAFKAQGGKLILWHGWADPALPAQATVDYYRQVQAREPNAGDYSNSNLHSSSGDP